MFGYLLNQLKNKSDNSKSQNKKHVIWVGSDLSAQNLPHFDITKRILPHLSEGHEVKEAILNLNAFAQEIKVLLADQITVIADDESSIRINNLSEAQISEIDQRYLRQLEHLISILAAYDWEEQPAIVQVQFQNYIKQLRELVSKAGSYQSSELDEGSSSSISSASQPSVDDSQLADLETVRQLIPERVYMDQGLPWPVIDFPHSRNWQDYNRLHFAKLSRARNQRLLAAHLEKDNEFAIIVDSGMGDGNALASYKRENNFTIGFSLQDLPQSNKEKIDACCFSPVPNGDEARRLFEILRGKVSRVIETYGAVTYDKHPLQALVYLGELLRPGGEANIICSEIKGDIDQSPLGFSANREAIVSFFKEELGLDVVIRRTTINSAVNVGEVCFDYHLHMTRSSNAKISDKSLDELFQILELRFGVCEVVPKKSDFGNFSHGFSIIGSTYTLPDEISQTESLLKENRILGAHWTVNQKNNEMRVEVGLAFESEASFKTFVNLFNELYIKHYNSDWKIRVDQETLSVRLDYYDKEMEQNDIQRRFGGTPGFFNKKPWQTMMYEGEELALCAQKHKAHEIANCIVKAINQIAVLVPSSGKGFDIRALEGSIAPLSPEIMERLEFNSTQVEEPSHLLERFNNQYLAMPALM